MANHLYKRGRIYWARVTKDGREYRQSLKTTARDVAQKRLRDWLEEMDRFAWGEKPRKTFEEAATHFMDHHLPVLRPASARRYEASLRKLTPHFEGMRLDEIDRATLRNFEIDRKRDGTSQPTIRRDLACLSSLFEEAAAVWDLDTVNPVKPFLKARAKRHALREAEPRSRYLSHDEEAALMLAAPADLAAQIAIAIDTGLRREELFDLTWDRVDLGRRQIRIDKTKTGKPRTVPLLERSAQIWAQSEGRIRTLSGPSYVFVSRTGTRFMQRQKLFQKVVTAAGLEDVRWHDLRRTCGCRLLQDHGMRIEDVSQWLGHQSIAQTQRAYAFFDVKQLHDAIGHGTKSGTGNAD